MDQGITDGPCSKHAILNLHYVEQILWSVIELNTSIVREYFNLLEKTLSENNLLRSPRQIYNCDEMFLPLDYTKEKAVTLRGSKNVYCQSLGSSDHITMLCAASAAGFPLPPMIIYTSHFLVDSIDSMAQMMLYMPRAIQVGSIKNYFWYG